MGRKAPATRQNDDPAISNLVKALTTEISPESVLETLRLLAKKLGDAEKEDSITCKLAVGKIMRAGALPTIIHHFCGTSGSGDTTQPDTMQASVSEAAAEVLNLLVCNGDPLPSLKVTTGLIHPLMKMLEAGTLLHCVTAAVLLDQLCKVQATAARTMAEAGVMELLLTLYMETQKPPYHSGLSTAVAILAFRVAISDAGGSRDFLSAIRATDPARAFACMVMIRVRH